MIRPLPYAPRTTPRQGTRHRALGRLPPPRGVSPNLRFEFLATWPGPILAVGSERVPLCALRPGWGEGVTFAARRGREVAHLGPNVRVFQRPLDILWTEKSKLASMLVVWSPRGPRVHDVGRMRRRGRVPGGLPDRPPDAARNATQAGATFAGH